MARVARMRLHTLYGFLYTATRSGKPDPTDWTDPTDLTDSSPVAFS